MQRERPYMIAAGWAVAAHRILLDPAPKVKILSAGRCLATSDSVRAHTGRSPLLEAFLARDRSQFLCAGTCVGRA